MNKTIAICCSANFYKQAIIIKDELASLGFTVLLPKGAIDMKKSGDFDTTRSKTWYNNPDDYHIKTDYIRSHFAEIKKSDIVLVLNYEKRGVKNYIGGNVLMEMAVAFDNNKQIYILNEAPEESPFIEEIHGLGSIFLHGDLDSLTKQLN